MITTRELNDGRRFRIYKRFYHPMELAHDLRMLGWECGVYATATYFLYGWASRALTPTSG